MSRKSLGVAIVIGSLMHASGHAFLAAAGGALARALGGGTGGTLGGASPMDARSMASMLASLGRGDALLGIAVAGLFAAVAKLVGGMLAVHAEARVAGEVGARLRLEVLDGVLALNSLRAPRHGDHGSAQDACALTTHVADAERGVSHGVLAEVRAVIQLAPLALLLVVLAPRLASSATVALAAFGLFAFGLRRAFKRAHVRAAANAERLSSAADEAVRHAELWATYGAEARIRAHVASLGRTMARESARLRARGALLSGTSEVLGALALVLALALVAAGAIAGVDRGALVPFAVAFFMAYRPLRDLIDARIVRARGEAACLAATSGVSSPHPPADRAARPVPFELGDLVIEGLVGAHGVHAPLSLRVPAGTIAAVVGPTGVGKSQLLRALLGLGAPREGRVSYASRSLDGAGVGPGERPFAWVPQDAPVLSDTIRENVGLAARSPREVRAALAAIGASDLARSAGDAVLGVERKLSGGERQQIAVARALATELPVLLLDEPTSALDAGAERRLLEAIAKLRGERTVVIVTHRTAPLAIADVVVRLSPRGDADDAKDGTRGHDEVIAAE